MPLHACLHANILNIETHLSASSPPHNIFAHVVDYPSLPQQTASTPYKVKSGMKVYHSMLPRCPSALLGDPASLPQYISNESLRFPFTKMACMQVISRMLLWWVGCELWPMIPASGEDMSPKLAVKACGEAWKRDGTAVSRFNTRRTVALPNPVLPGYRLK